MWTEVVLPDLANSLLVGTRTRLARSSAASGQGRYRCDERARLSATIGACPAQFDPPSGTRDFLAADVEQREHAFAVIRSVFARYGFEPLQTPAFERLDVLLGKYGEEADKLVFKILRRGEHEASGEADLALRYDMTVPLAASPPPTAASCRRRTSGTRSARSGEPTGRARTGTASSPSATWTRSASTSLLADAEVLCAQHDALAELGLPDFTILLNSRRVLAGLLDSVQRSRRTSAPAC